MVGDEAHGDVEVAAEGEIGEATVETVDDVAPIGVAETTDDVEGAEPTE